MIKTFRPMLWESLMRRANLVMGAGLAVIALAISLFVHERALIPTVIGFPILAIGMACLVAAGASPHGLIGRMPIPGAGAVAAMAYSLYLTHKQVFHMVQSVADGRLNGHPIAQTLLYGGAALAAGGLLYWTVERPAIRLRDRLLRDRRATHSAKSNAASSALEASA
jgi:peptidoglycan/LPS O-acetylase OafA/YrhL